LTAVHAGVLCDLAGRSFQGPLEHAQAGPLIAVAFGLFLLDGLNGPQYRRRHAAPHPQYMHARPAMGARDDHVTRSSGWYA